MIIPMIKYDFVLYSGEHNQFLNKLQDLGLVDVTISGWEASESERALIGNIELHKKALSQFTTMEAVGAAKYDSSEEAFSNYIKASEDNHKIAEQIAKMERESDETFVWGNFSIDAITELTNHGLGIHFFSVYTDEYDKRVEKWKEREIIEFINDFDGKTYFIVVADQLAVIEIDAQELKAPTATVEAIDKEIAKLELEQQSNSAILLRCAASSSMIADNLAKLESELQFSQVTNTAKVEADGTLIILEGWATKASCQSIDTMLQSYPNMIFFKNRPTPKDNTPVLLRNNGFAKLFELIGNFYALPKYGTMDLTPFFAPFYMLFFGFCLADAGYGLMLMLGGLALLIKGGDGLKMAAKLTLICGLSTVIFGFCVGSFFGVQLAQLDMFVGIRDMFLTTDNLFSLAIGIGIFQILFGMTLKVITITIQFGLKYALSTIGWLIVIISSIAAYAAPEIGISEFGMDSIIYKVIIGIGVAMMLLLNTPGRNPILNIGAGLWNTYNDVTSLLGDVLSYIRLFAIGLSGGILAMVFNQLAFGLSGDTPVVREIAIVLILFIGHSINLFMSTLSSFVHPMRLTFVEFYKNAGFEAGNRAFSPLKRDK